MLAGHLSRTAATFCGPKGDRFHCTDLTSSLHSVPPSGLDDAKPGCPDVTLELAVVVAFGQSRGEAFSLAVKVTQLPGAEAALEVNALSL